jgi:hypothetical protein
MWNLLRLFRFYTKTAEPVVMDFVIDIDEALEENIVFILQKQNRSWGKGLKIYLLISLPALNHNE